MLRAQTLCADFCLRENFIVMIFKCLSILMSVCSRASIHTNVPVCVCSTYDTQEADSKHLTFLYKETWSWPYFSYWETEARRWVSCCLQPHSGAWGRSFWLSLQKVCGSGLQLLALFTYVCVHFPLHLPEEDKPLVLGLGVHIISCPSHDLVKFLKTEQP